jgi:uncharacterized protein (TIGR02466 family)
MLAMAHVETLFVTKVYRAELEGAGRRRTLAALEAACRSIAEDDAAGQAWCKANDYPGYTSYASLADLPQRFPEIGALGSWIAPHVDAFAREIELDLGRGRLDLDSLWINVLAPGGYHTAHIHPYSVVSGTFYVSVPKGASALKLEDPRLAMMMAAPPRRARASRECLSFVSLEPRPGTLLLWESWLRHEVPVNRAETERISVSFNYRWS